MIEESVYEGPQGEELVLRSPHPDWNPLIRVQLARGIVDFVLVRSGPPEAKEQSGDD